MAEGFADRVERLVSKAEFAEAVKQVMGDVLGETGAKAAIYHLGGEKVLREPRLFERRLREVFGAGAEIILEHIVRKLESVKP